jgi:hypothetical protein
MKTILYIFQKPYKISNLVKIIKPKEKPINIKQNIEQINYTNECIRQYEIITNIQEQQKKNI